jgi:6-phosphogluconolactonase
MGLTAAELFVNQVKTVLKKNELFTVVFSGGSTPKKMFEYLGGQFSKRIPWSQIHLFWADERLVPPQHQESNFRLVSDTLLKNIEISPQQIHRIRTEVGEPREVSIDYEKNLRLFFEKNYCSTLPQFDLVFLGIGEDGHTASLFADGEPPVDQSNLNWVISPWVPHLDAYRISLSPFAINLAKKIVFLVSGAGKAKVVHQVELKDQQLPVVKYIKGDSVEWILDEAAASQINKKAAA